MSAALIGSGVGLSLGAAYLAGGMARHAADHSRVERIAEAAAGGYSEAVLQQETATLGPAVLRLVRQHDPLAAADEDRQLTQLAERLQRQQGRASGAMQASRDLECLTQAVYYEARGESSHGQFAVAQVVMNRVKHPAFPKTVCGVVFQGAGRRTGCQFSFTCDGSMRRGREASAWRRAHRVAARVLAGAAIADVGSATHFHTTAVAPAWGPQMRRVAQVGMHVFYKFNPRRAAAQNFPQAPSAMHQAVLTAASAAQPELRLTSAILETAAEVAPPQAGEPAPVEAKAPAVEAPKPAEAATLKSPQPADAAAS